MSKGIHGLAHVIANANILLISTYSSLCLSLFLVICGDWLYVTVTRNQHLRVRVPFGVLQ